MNKELYGTTLCLSGVESRRLLDTFADFHVPHIQLSYYYLRKVFANPQEFEEYASTFSTVILDHGLIYHKYKSEVEKKEFLNEYAMYVANLDRDVYQAVVTHPDIQLDKVIDTSKLIYNLEDLEDLFEGDMKAVFSQVEYIGLGHKLCNNEERMGYIASQAAKYGTKLHAFGTSSIRVLKRWPIYSANSSSWRTGSRFANTYLYEGPTRGLKIYQPTDKSDLAKTDREKRVIRTRLKNMTQSRQPELYEKVSWEDLLEDDSWEVDKANLTQWLLYQQDLELDTNPNKYWLTDKDRQLLQIRKSTLLGLDKQGGEERSRGSSIDGPPYIERGVREEESPISEALEREAYIEENVHIEGGSIEGEIVEEGEEVPINQDNQNNGMPSPAYKAGFPAKKVEKGAVSRLRDTRITPIDDRLITARECDFCILANRCPKYSAGSPCAFGLTDSYLPSNIEDHIHQDVADLMALQKDRILQGYLEEKSDASGLNKDLSREVRLYLEMVELYSASMDKRDELTVKAKGTGILGMFSK